MNDKNSDNQEGQANEFNISHAAPNSKRKLSASYLNRPPILLPSNSVVNTQWQKLVSEMQYDIIHKLKGLTLEPERWLEGDIEILDIAGYTSARQCVANGLPPRHVVFIAHDDELFTHIAAYIDKTGNCSILAVWPCNEDGVKGKASNRQPEPIMSQITRIYQEITQ